MHIRRVFLTAAAGLLASSAATADVRLANIFSDNMVLQRGRPVRVWGWAEPGQEVTVTITASRDEALAQAGKDVLYPPPAEEESPRKGKQEPEENPYKVRICYEEFNAPEFKTVRVQAKAGDDGLWVAGSAPLAASFAPKFLIASAGGSAAAIKNVLVGEVWVCAGQSNMFWSGNRTKWIDSEGLLPSGVRYAHTGRSSSPKPRTDLAERVNWFECTEENARGISTIPYLFGKFLHTRLGVPVGIVNAASGGAMGNYWCSLDELHEIDFGPVKRMMDAYDQAVAEWDDPAGRKRILDEYEKKFAAAHAEWEKEAAAAKANKKKPPKEPAHKPPTRPRTGSLASFLYNARIAPIGRLPVRGAIYLQGEQQVLGWAVEQYRHTFPAVVRSFRAALGEDLAFGVIALQGAAHTKGNLGEMDMGDRSSVVREIHYKTALSMPNTGFICAADVGLGLHPNHKRPVAERAAHWALRAVYGNIPDESLRAKVEFAGDKAIVHVEQRKTVTQRDRKTKEVKVTKVWRAVKFQRWSSGDTFPLTGFMIAGADRRWYPGTVRRDANNNLLITNDLLDKPVALRYGWGSFPHANVGPWENPLPPFRTDDWPLPKGQDLTEETKGQARSEFYASLHEGFEQMLDRMIRQGRMDAAIGEMQLYPDAAGILNSKADRIEAILDETAPAFFHSPRMRWMDDRDWKTERMSGSAVGKVPAKAEELDAALQDKEIAESVAELRKALKRYRKAVENAK